METKPYTLFGQTRTLTPSEAVPATTTHTDRNIMNHKIIGITLLAIFSLASYTVQEPALAALGLILGSLYYFGKVAK